MLTSAQFFCHHFIISPWVAQIIGLNSHTLVPLHCLLKLIAGWACNSVAPGGSSAEVSSALGFHLARHGCRRINRRRHGRLAPAQKRTQIMNNSRMILLVVYQQCWWRYYLETAAWTNGRPCNCRIAAHYWRNHPAAANSIPLSSPLPRELLATALAGPSCATGQRPGNHTARWSPNKRRWMSTFVIAEPRWSVTVRVTTDVAHESVTGKVAPSWSL